jgi:hypothetical protein
VAVPAPFLRLGHRGGADHSVDLGGEVLPTPCSRSAAGRRCRSPRPPRPCSVLRSAAYAKWGVAGHLWSRPGQPAGRRRPGLHRPGLGGGGTGVATCRGRCLRVAQPGATGPTLRLPGLVVFARRPVTGSPCGPRRRCSRSRCRCPWQEQPGRPAVREFDSRVKGAGHAMIVVRPGLAVEARTPGCGQAGGRPIRTPLMAAGPVAVLRAAPGARFPSGRRLTPGRIRARPIRRPSSVSRPPGGWQPPAGCFAASG